MKVLVFLIKIQIIRFRFHSRRLWNCGRMFGFDGKDSLQNIPILHLRVLRPIICNGMCNQIDSSRLFMWVFVLLKSQYMAFLLHYCFIRTDILNILVFLASNFQNMFVEALQGSSQSRLHAVIFGQSRHHFIHVSHAITPYFLINRAITLILFLQSHHHAQFYTHSRHYAKFS